MPVIKAGNINLNYDTFGDGEPLLLIMGFGMSGAGWLPSLPFFNGFKCIYFDNRGTGLSDKPEGIYTIEAMADDASNLLSALGIPKAKVFGVSMGGMIAQELTLGIPSKSARSCSDAPWRAARRRRWRRPKSREAGRGRTRSWRRIPSRDFDHAAAAAHARRNLSHGASRDQADDAGGSEDDAADAAGGGRPRDRGNQTFNAYDRLGQIKCPVLIVHGDKDMLVPPENANMIKSQIPQAEVFMIPNAGHAFQAADPVGIHKRIVTG